MQRHWFPRAAISISTALILAAAVASSAARGADLGTDRPPASADYRNPSLPAETRVRDLLSRMTLSEKIAQLLCTGQIGGQANPGGTFDAARAGALLRDGMGEIAPMDGPADSEVALRNSAQKFLIENTRLGIPAIFHDEACHGFRDFGATSFPAPIGLACAWDPQLTERIFRVVAAEMRARGVSQALCPVVDICRDPRWGRTDETMGEDPYLNGTLAAAVVRGLQGTSDGSIAPGHVAATLKHFAGHGQPEAGINRAPGDIPTRELYDAHLVPFRIAIAQGHPAAVMPSYNEIDGVPSHGNSWLLHDVLRQQFGFTGLVVSDYTGVEYLAVVDGVATDMPAAALLAFQSGVDVNLPDGAAYPTLKQSVDQGKLPTADLDAAVARVLRLKLALGLFEHPFGDAGAAAALPGLPSSVALARQAADESIVLLKNQGGILPLSPGKYKTIAVIGPNAHSARLGSYSGEPPYSVSILDGLKARIGDRAKVIDAVGCQIVTNLPASSLAAWQRTNEPEFPTDQENRANIAQAVDVAKQADLVLLVLGENEMLSRESWATNHVGDRVSLDLIGAQNDLADAIFALGKPVVVYLMNGRPLAVTHIADRADALIEGWYMGQETGNAAADILLGYVNPSGKLTITIPRATGEVPDYYDYKPGARLYNFVDASSKPLFPFGFGLSYTHFDYSDPAVSSPTIKRDGMVQVSSTITNRGTIVGDEIVELFIRQRGRTVTRPVKELKGFSRVSLQPGQSQKVTFSIGPDALAFHDIHMNDVVEPGEVELMVGPSSAEVKTARVRIVP